MQVETRFYNEILSHPLTTDPFWQSIGRLRQNLLRNEVLLDRCTHTERAPSCVMKYKYFFRSRRVSL